MVILPFDFVALNWQIIVKKSLSLSFGLNKATYVLSRLVVFKQKVHKQCQKDVLFIIHFYKKEILSVAVTIRVIDY